MAQTPPADPTPPAATGTPPAAEADKAGSVGTGPVVPSATLEAIQLPKPKKAPDKGTWQVPIATHDGDRLVNFADGTAVWLTVHFTDCNLPAAKDAGGKPAGQRGQFEFCYEKPVGKVKDFPLYGTGDTVRGVKAGHLLIVIAIGGAAPQSYTTTDVEEYLGTLDLAAFAKL